MDDLKTNSSMDRFIVNSEPRFIPIRRRVAGICGDATAFNFQHIQLSSTFN